MSFSAESPLQNETHSSDHLSGQHVLDSIAACYTHNRIDVWHSHRVLLADHADDLRISAESLDKTRQVRLNA